MGKANNPFYKTKQWKLKRAKIMRRDKYQCQISKRFGKSVEATTVHHIYPLEDYPQFALCDWNLISVGDKVNNQLHDRKTGKLTKLGLDLMARTLVPLEWQGIPHSLANFCEV